MEGIGRDSALLYEAESEEVVIARDTFASLRQYLVTLQEEVRTAKACLESAFETMSWQTLKALPSDQLRVSGLCSTLFVTPYLAD